MEQYIEPKNGAKIFNVVGDFDESLHPLNYKEGKAYIFPDGHVRVYSLARLPQHPYPYFYHRDGKYNTGYTEKSLLDEFVKERIVSTSIKTINKNTPEDFEPFNEEAVNAMNAAAEIYRPEIKPEDDALKRIIKQAILEKGINISRLNADVDRKCTLNNMKSALAKSTRMSIDYFTKWCELLGLDFMVCVMDNGCDTIDPMKKPVYYRSELDKVIVGEYEEERPSRTTIRLENKEDE